MEDIATAIATPNIALVKYWGKRNDRLILPENDSVSITLDESVKTTTTVLFSDRLSRDAFYIDGSESKIEGVTATAMDVLMQIKKMANEKRHVLIASENTFPSGTGLASSASGSMALVYAACSALKLEIDAKGLSMLARQASGSACRSAYGGFVRWLKGSNDDGSDSYAKQIADEKHWNEVIDIIAIVDQKKKKVASREGQALTKETSKLYALRKEIAQEHADAAENAIIEKDFERLAMLIMTESNNMHAVMTDTFPPLLYLNDVSKSIIYAIHELNESSGSAIAAYTFDAGPNAHIITKKQNVHEVTEMLEGIEGIRNIIECRQGSGPRLSDASVIKDEMYV